MRSRLVRPRLLLPVLAALAAAAAGGQEAVASDASSESPEAIPGEVVREEIEVPLRSIRVVVSDGSGDPVEGLEAAAFRLLHDGEPLAIAGVEPLATARLRDRANEPPGATREGAVPETDLGSSPPRPDGAPRHLVLFVDGAFLAPGDLADLGPLLDELAGGVWRAGSEQLTLLVGSRGIERLAGPTSDPGEVAAAWRERVLPPGDGVTLRSESRQILRQIEAVAASGPDVQARRRDLLPVTLRGQIETYAAVAEAATRRTVRRLEVVVGAVSGLPGTTEIVYVGGRLPAAAAHGLKAAWVSAFGPSSSWWLDRGQGGVGGGLGASSDDIPSDIDPPSLSPDLEVGPMLAPLIERAGALGIVIHVLDAGALRADAFLERDAGVATGRGGGGPAPSVADASSFGDAEALAALAEGTGGLAMIGSRVFRPILAERDPPGSYRLYFRPPVLDGEVHRLEVEVEGRRRWRVSHPSAYRHESLADQQARRTVSALLLGLEAHDPLGFRAEVLAAAEPGGSPRLRVALPLDRVGLVPESDAHVGSLGVTFAWGGMDAGVSPIRRARIPIRIPNRELFVALGQDAEAVLPIEPPPRAPALAVTLYDEVRAATGTRVVPLPGAGDPAPETSAGDAAEAVGPDPDGTSGR